MAVRMIARAVFRVAVTTVKVAPLKTHENLTAAGVLPLALYGRKNFDKRFLFLCHVSLLFGSEFTFIIVIVS